MIRMTRVRLINWHNFVDNTIDFKTVTYLIGVNAVGKTTILDAIRYCLTTNRNFNAAGNKRSKRSLQGSVHQKQRADNVYLRPGHTVSYIGIEFLDESIRKRFTIVARVESESPYQNLKQVYQDWYISKPGYTLDDLPFFIQGKSGKRPSKREEFKLDNRGMDRAASQADARRRICRQLGIGDADSNTGKKFNTVFHMGTSLENIDNIRDFIHTYILPDPEVNIEGLYKDMQELENLQQVLEESRLRADSLEEINKQLEEALVRDTRVRVYEVLLSYAQWQADLQKRKSLSDNLSSVDLELSVLDTQVQDLAEKCRDAHSLLLDAQRRLGDDENHQKMESLHRELDEKKKEYDRLRANAARFDQTVDLFERLSHSLLSHDIAKSSETELPAPEAKDYTDKIGNLQAKMTGYSEVLRDQYAQIISDIRLYEQDIDKLSGEIKELESGRMVYPPECRTVLDAINSLLRENGINDEAKLLCELLYMNRPEWQDAVESYLNTQRLYIIVSPEHYWIAKQAFMSLGDQVKGIGLVDTLSLMKRKSRPADNSVLTLAQTVGTGNPYARAYIDFRLGDVVCCDSADDLERYHKSVTTDRLRYQGYVLQRMRKQTSFIGQDAIKRRLEQATAELQDRQRSRTEQESKRQALSSLDDRYRSFMAGDAFSVLSSYYRARPDAESTFEEISSLDSRIRELERNPMLQGMLDREAECREAYEQASSRLTDRKAARKEAENRQKKIQQLLQQLASHIEKSERNYREYQETCSRYIPDMEKEYADLTRRQTPAEIIANNQSQGTLQRRINERDMFISNTLIPLQNQYNAAYSHDYLPGLAGLEQYQTAYQTLVKIDIERHQENLRLAQMRCKERFRKEVLFRMKDDIERAKRLFRELNKVMSGLKYGEESYEFFLSGSREKDMQIFYNLIMDKDNKQIREEVDLFSFMDEPASDVFESQIEDFMQRIMSEVKERSMQSVSGQKQTGHEPRAYADYRTYLHYDILVKNSVTNQTAYLTEVSGDGSGGENQAPFYVAICASLLQIYQQSENCIQLVLLDEAFNNMTSDRIKPMMEMFRSLNLQLILIATPEKCTSIYPYCDITYSIVKQGSRNAIGSFELVEK